MKETESERLEGNSSEDLVGEVPQDAFGIVLAICVSLIVIVVSLPFFN